MDYVRQHDSDLKLLEARRLVIHERLGKQRGGAADRKNGCRVTTPGPAAKRTCSPCRVARCSLPPATGRCTGRGATAAVFRGTYDGKDVAVKKYYYRSLDSASVDRFCRETRMIRCVTTEQPTH
jgi:hypothetical protein